MIKKLLVTFALCLFFLELPQVISAEDAPQNLSSTSIIPSSPNALMPRSTIVQPERSAPPSYLDRVKTKVNQAYRSMSETYSGISQRNSKRIEAVDRGAARLRNQAIEGAKKTGHSIRSGLKSAYKATGDAENKINKWGSDTTVRDFAKGVKNTAQKARNYATGTQRSTPAEEEKSKEGTLPFKINKNILDPKTYQIGGARAFKRGEDSHSAPLLEETPAGNFKTLNGEDASDEQIQKYKKYKKTVDEDEEKTGKKGNALPNTTVKLWEKKFVDTKSKDGHRIVMTKNGPVTIKMFTDSKGKQKAAYLNGKRQGSYLTDKEIAALDTDAGFTMDAQMQTHVNKAEASFTNQGLNIDLQKQASHEVLRVNLTTGQQKLKLGKHTTADVETSAEGRLVGEGTLTGKGEFALDHGKVEVKAGGVLGLNGKAQGKLTLDMSEYTGIKVQTTATVEGTLGAQAEANGVMEFNVRTGRIRVSGKAAAALGAGGGGSGTVEIDAQELVRVADIGNSQAARDRLQSQQGHAVNLIGEMLSGKGPTHPKIKLAPGKKGLDILNEINKMSSDDKRLVPANYRDLAEALEKSGFIKKVLPIDPNVTVKPTETKPLIKPNTSGSQIPTGGNKPLVKPNLSAQISAGSNKYGAKSGKPIIKSDTADNFGGVQDGANQFNNSGPANTLPNEAYQDRINTNSSGQPSATGDISQIYTQNIVARQNLGAAAQRAEQAQSRIRQTQQRIQEAQQLLNNLQRNNQQLSAADSKRAQQLSQIIQSGQSRIQSQQTSMQQAQADAAQFTQTIQDIQDKHGAEIDKIRAEAQAQQQSQNQTQHQGNPIDPSAQTRVDAILNATPEPGGGPNGKDDNDNGMIDEGYNHPRFGNVRIIMTDNGGVEDDSFQMSVAGKTSPAMPIGKSLLWPVNLPPGTHDLTMTCLKAPDNLGTYYIYGVGNCQISESSTMGEGATVTIKLTVTGGSSK